MLIDQFRSVRVKFDKSCELEKRHYSVMGKQSCRGKVKLF